MKLWLAKLKLQEVYEERVEDDFYYTTSFSFKYIGDNYELNQYNEWSNEDCLFSEKIPNYIEVKKYYDYVAIQGFNRELTSSELEEVEKQMKAEIYKIINGRMQMKINTYKLMLKPLIS